MTDNWHKREAERRDVEAELMREAGGDVEAALGLAAQYVAEFEDPYSGPGGHPKRPCKGPPVGGVSDNPQCRTSDFRGRYEHS
jgi:hypothetical protein